MDRERIGEGGGEGEGEDGGRCEVDATGEEGADRQERSKSKSSNP